MFKYFSKIQFITNLKSLKWKIGQLSNFNDIRGRTQEFDQGIWDWPENLHKTIDFTDPAPPPTFLLFSGPCRPVANEPVLAEREVKTAR